MLQVNYGLTWGAVAQGLAVGLLVSLLFSLVPLLEVRHVKPSLLLRQEIPPRPTFDWVKWSVTRPSPDRWWPSLVQAGSLEVGLLLSGGFVAIAFVLHLAGVALVRACAPLRYARSFALRQRCCYIARRATRPGDPGSAVGLAPFFFLPGRSQPAGEPAPRFLRPSGREHSGHVPVDIQSSHATGVMALIDRENGQDPAPRLIPVLRARIVAWRGRDVNLESY